MRLPPTAEEPRLQRRGRAHAGARHRGEYRYTLSSNWHEIVGVIKDVKLTGLDAPTTPEVYQSDLQSGVWMFSLVVRSTLPLREIEKMVRAEAAALDKELPTFNVRTMEQAISTSVAPRRFIMMLIGLFAALALM